MADAEFLYLTTTGWKSGNPHEIEIWYTEYQGNYYIMAEFGEKAHWVQNIQRNSAIQIRVGSLDTAGIGRVLKEVEDAEVLQAVRARFKKKYNWDDGLLVELKPQKP